MSFTRRGTATYPAICWRMFAMDWRPNWSARSRIEAWPLRNVMSHVTHAITVRSAANTVVIATRRVMRPNSLRHAISRSTSRRSADSRFCLRSACRMLKQGPCQLDQSVAASAFGERN